MALEQVTVCIRVRPPAGHEKVGGKTGGLSVRDATTIEVGKKLFACSQTFGSHSTQQDVFTGCGVEELLEAAMRGYRATLFAYGQTGAGKTHTVLGEQSHGSEEDLEGVVPRGIRKLFEHERAHHKRDIRMRVSVLEIYREVVTDLLDGGQSRTSLPVREHPKYGFFVDGLHLAPCTDLGATLATVEGALRSRTTGSHDLNVRSSRSHCMLTVHIDSLPRATAEAGADAAGAQASADLSSVDTDGPVQPPTYGSITFVDLAGSERLGATGSSGTALREACHINKSLYTLGKVIRGMLSAQGKSGKRGGVSYRDSNMTKLLIGSLGGSGKTVMIGCVSPAASQSPESIRTMQFAMQVGRIRNKPVINLDPQEKLIKELKDEIHRLRDENARLRSSMLATPGSLMHGGTGPVAADPAEILSANLLSSSHTVAQPAPSGIASQSRWSETAPVLPLLETGPASKSLTSASSLYGKGKTNRKQAAGKRRSRPDHSAAPHLPRAPVPIPSSVDRGMRPHVHVQGVKDDDAESQVMSLLMQLGTNPTSPQSSGSPEGGPAGVGGVGDKSEVGIGQVDALLATVGLGSIRGSGKKVVPTLSQHNPGPGVSHQAQKFPLMKNSRVKKRGKVPSYGSGQGYEDLMQRHQHRNSGSFLF